MLKVLAISFLVLFLTSIGLDHAFAFKTDQETIEWQQAENDQHEHEDEKEEDSTLEAIQPSHKIHKRSFLLDQAKGKQTFQSSKDPFCPIFLPPPRWA